MSEENREKNQEENSEQIMITPGMLFRQIMIDFNFVFGSVVIAVVIFYYLKDNKTLTLKEKILYISFPVILSLVIFLIINIPDPKKDYVISLFYGQSPVTSKFKHKNNEGWIFPGSASIKINGKVHLFVGGGNNQKDALLLYNTKTNRFDNVINKTNLSSMSNSYSAVSYDINHDGKEDLIVGRQDCVILYKNLGDYKFEEHKLVGKLDKVPLAIAVSDFNKDGNPDIYLSYFTPINKYKGSVFNDLSHGRKNILLQNISSDKIEFKDVTKETNAGGLSLNTFTGAFVDVNNDSWPDIVLSHDSGEIEILANKEGKFESKIPFKEKGNWMGLAVGDIDNDGDQDLFLTNIGNMSIGNEIAYGDIKKDQKQAFKHALLINEGDFKFKEKSHEKGIDNYGFGWGALFADVNMDGQEDLLFAENTKLYPVHHVLPQPGHYYENKDGNFKRKFNYNNRYFGQTPMYVDINNDNKKDVIWINMGGPVNAYLNKNNNNYIVVSLPSTQNMTNAKIVLDTGSKKFYKENIVGGTGFGSDTSDNNILFGLGKHDTIKTIKVYTLDGREHELKNPKVNSVVKLIVQSK